MSNKETCGELLSAYLDGELSGAELSQFERALRATPAMEEELRALRDVREQVGIHLRTAVASQKLNLWSALESQLEPKSPPAERARRDAENTGVLEWARGLFIPRIDYRVVAAFGVLMFAVGLATSQWVDLPSSKSNGRGSGSELAANARNPNGTDLNVSGLENLAANNLDVKEGGSPIYVPLLPDNMPRLHGDLKYVSNTGGPNIGFSPQFVRPPTLGAEHPARNAGYRTNGIDIEWVQSPKGLTLLRPSKREIAPGPLGGRSVMGAFSFIRPVFLLSIFAPVWCFAQANAPAARPGAPLEAPKRAKAPAVRCGVSARLVEATHGRAGKGGKGSDDSEESEEEKEQLKTLPYGSFRTLSAQHADLELGQPGSLELPQSDGDKFLVKVTPHSFADNKVHYSVEWTTPKDKSVVATRLGVENGRNIFLGTDTLEGPKKRCLVVGIKVRCQKDGEKDEAKAEK